MIPFFAAGSLEISAAAAASMTSIPAVDFGWPDRGRDAGSCCQLPFP
jgi:hypothetical protein